MKVRLRQAEGRGWSGQAPGPGPPGPESKRRYGAETARLFISLLIGGRGVASALGRGVVWLVLLIMPNNLLRLRRLRF